MGKCRLLSPGWNSQTRQELERLLTGNAGEGLPVVLDFDNTLVAGDIGEATLAVLAHTKRLLPAKVPRELCPPFRLPRRGWVRIEHCQAVTDYYEALLEATTHLRNDATPLANGYAWAVQVLSGLRIADVTRATLHAYHWQEPKDSAVRVTPPPSRHPQYIRPVPGKPGYLVPRFYEETVELLAELLRLRYDVWIVSASNVWSVRWMVHKVLGYHLRQRRCGATVRPEQVIGISTLLQDSSGKLYKDPALARAHRPYAAMQETAMHRFHLTSQLHFPVTAYSGKVEALFEDLRRVPFLAVGDSPSDHPMLLASQNRLWLARPDKPSYLEQTRALLRRTGHDGWMFQAVEPKQGSFSPAKVPL